MARFLFTMWDGGGSLPPELTVVRQLVAAGHAVTMVGDPVTEPEVQATGVTDFRPWVDAPHHDTRRAEDDYIRDWELRNPTRVLANLMDTLMVIPAPLFAAETLAAIDDVQPDAVVSSFPLLGALMAAEVRRVPCAALVPNVVSLPADGMPPFGTGFLPPKGRLGRARDRTLNALVDRLWNKGLPELNRVRATLGLHPLDRLLAQYEQPERILALTGASFDFPAALPPNVRYVGPQLDDPEWAEPWSPPDDDLPFVLVAMSTTFMDHVDQLQRAVTALGTLPVQSLVTTGPAIDPDQIDAPGGDHRRALGASPPGARARRRAAHPRRPRHRHEGSRRRRAHRVHAHRPRPAGQRGAAHLSRRRRQDLEEGATGQDRRRRRTVAGRPILQDRSHAPGRAAAH